MKKLLLLAIATVLFNTTAMADQSCQYECRAFMPQNEIYCQGLDQYSCESEYEMCYLEEVSCEPTPSEGMCHAYIDQNEGYCNALDAHSCNIESWICYWSQKR